MARRRITQLFPFLLPMRKKQRKLYFYLRMRLDGRQYARTVSAQRLPCLLFESRCPMHNSQTGFPMAYQDNKIHNLRLAAKTLDGLLIRPGETFSFWQRVQYADKDTPYRDGLVEIDSKLTTERGGGLCQMSNLLFWTLLHTPLAIAERRGHAVKGFPEPPSDAPIGVDATVAEGWLDLKIQNNTGMPYQIGISFDGDRLVGRVYAAEDTGVRYAVENGALSYVRQGGRTYEEVDVIRRTLDTVSGTCIQTEFLYRNKCVIGYALPDTATIIEKG